MARSDDYQVNESGWGPAYQIQLADLGLVLFGRSPISGQFGPGQTTAEGGPGERSLIFDSFVNGMGMAYSGVERTYAFAKNMYLRNPKKAMPGGLLTEISLDDLAWTTAELGGEIRAAIDHSGDVVIGAGRHIIRLTAGEGAPTDEYDVGVDCQIQDGLVYNSIPLFSTDQYADNWQYLTAYDALASAWVTANADGTEPGYSIRVGAANYQDYPQPVYLEHLLKLFQEVDGVGGNRIFGNDTPFTYVQTQTSDLDQLIGDASVWSASLEAGERTAPITGAAGTNRIPFILKTDSVRGIESAGIYCPNYVPDLERDVHPYNGAFGVFIFDRLFVSTPQGLLMCNVADRRVQFIPTYVNPAYYFTNETPVFGRPTAYTVDNGWLVVSLWNGRDSHICYTRPREATLATIPSPMIWHGSECTIEGERITMLHKTSVSGSPQILVGTHDGDRMHLYSLSVPEEGDPYVDYLHGESSHRFATSGRLYLPFQDAGDANAKKVIRRFDVQADGLSLPVVDEDGHPTGDATQAGEITLYANADAGSRVFFEAVEPGSSEPGDGLPDSEWIEQGVISDSPSATLIPTLETMAGKQIGVLLDWELVNQASEEDDPIYSPFSVRSIKIRTDLYVDELETKTYTVLLGHMQQTATGGHDQGDPQSKFVALAALQNADVVYMVNEWHERLLVKMESGLSYQWLRESVDQPPSLVVTFKVTVMGRQFYWDIGHTYDGVYSWAA